MKTVNELAKEAGFSDAWHKPLERFVALVRAEREWVDLTDDEIDMVLSLVGSDAPFHTKYRAVIAAFKEKNK